MIIPDRRSSEGGPGVPKSLGGSRSPDRSYSHAQIFFRARGVLIPSTEIKQSKAESFQWSTTCRCVRSTIYFQEGGGLVKSRVDREPGPAG